jgi:hypothetical protein
VARLTVADEYVFYALLDADLSWQEAREQARNRFAQALERSDLRVQVMPLGGGRRWLAAAVADTDLRAWSAALEAVGVQLTHLHAALIEDMRSLVRCIPEDDAVIALLREEGVSLVRLKDGLPIALAWERFDTGEVEALEQRLRAFVREAAGQVGVGHQCVIYMLPESKALCRYVWDGRDLPGLFPRPLEGIGTRHMARPQPWQDHGSRPESPNEAVRPPSIEALPQHGTAARQARPHSATRPPPMPLPEVVELHHPAQEARPPAAPA